MVLLQDATVVWVVLDPAGEVVLLAYGANAGEAAHEWQERGYTVRTLPAEQVHAA